MKLHVVYFWTIGILNGFGDIEFEIHTEMLTSNDISKIRKKIMNNGGYDNVVILNWKEIR